MGHEPIAFGSAFPEARGNVTAVATELARKVTRFDLKFQARVSAQARDSNVEIVITVESLSPETVEAIRETGARTAFWFPDAVSNLGRTSMFVAPYDGLFFKQRSLVDRARRLLGVPVHHLLEACNPSWHTADPSVDPEPFIVVAGGMYPFRVRVLERLVRAGIPLRIFGPPSPRWLSAPLLEPLHEGVYLTRHHKAREFRRAAAVLDTLHPAELEGYNARLFEATGCGAATLVDASPELNDLYEPDEVLAFTDFDELLERCRWAIDNMDEARQLGDRAQKRAHRDHTYDVRLTTIFEKVMG
jgi:hypothetical protein